MIQKDITHSLTNLLEGDVQSFEKESFDILQQGSQKAVNYYKYTRVIGFNRNFNNDIQCYVIHGYMLCAINTVNYVLAIVSPLTAVDEDSTHVKSHHNITLETKFHTNRLQLVSLFRLHVNEIGIWESPLVNTFSLALLNSYTYQANNIKFFEIVNNKRRSVKRNAPDGKDAIIQALELRMKEMKMTIRQLKDKVKTLEEMTLGIGTK